MAETNKSSNNKRRALLNMLGGGIARIGGETVGARKGRIESAVNSAAPAKKK